MDINKIPPHNIDAEAALLGCLFFNNKNIDIAACKIKPDDFYRDSHRIIYDTILKLHNTGKPIDCVILATTLKDKLNRVGGTDYLLDLENTVPHDHGLSYYISEVKSNSQRRKQIELAIQVFNNAYSESVSNESTIEEIKQLIENSQTKADDTGIVCVKDIYKEIDDLYEKGLIKGVKPGWYSVEPYYTVRPGEMSIITGIPSHGKSTWQTNLMVNIASNEGWKFAVFSPENKPIQRHVAQIMQMFVQKPFNRGYTHRITEGEKEYAKDWINNHFVFIAPKDDELTIDSIINKAVICAIKHGIKGIVIDPWNEVDHSRPPGINETEYISRCLSKLRNFARNYQIHVWLVAHPTKLIKTQDGSYPVPTPYDISGSSHFRNKADCCICVYRNTDDNITDIHIQKIRFSEVGKTGKVQLKYNVVTSSYFDFN